MFPDGGIGVLIFITSIAATWGLLRFGVHWFREKEATCDGQQ